MCVCLFVCARAGHADTSDNKAQPNKLRIKAQNDTSMEEKMLAKAQVISSAANRLWSMYIKTAY